MQLICELCPSLNTIERSGKIAHIVQHREATPGIALSFLVHAIHDSSLTFTEAVVERVKDRDDRAAQYHVGIIPRNS